eukprot:Hpha_TRINITY_DN26824_c0_g1::TRINITY_DN26824_c0_g1_i1::g.17217::m.17217
MPPKTRRSIVSRRQSKAVVEPEPPPPPPPPGSPGREEEKKLERLAAEAQSRAAAAAAEVQRRHQAEAEERAAQAAAYQQEQEKAAKNLEEASEREFARLTELQSTVALSARQALYQSRRSALRNRTRLVRLLPYERRRGLASPLIQLAEGTEARLASVAAAHWELKPGSSFEELAEVLTPKGGSTRRTAEVLRLTSQWWVRSRGGHGDCGAARRLAAVLREETFESALARWPAFAARVGLEEPAPEVGADNEGNFRRVTAQWVRSLWSPCAEAHWRLRSWMLRTLSEDLGTGIPPGAGMPVQEKRPSSPPWPIALRADSVSGTAQDCSMPPVAETDVLKLQCDRLQQSTDQALGLCEEVSAKLSGLRQRLGELRGGAELLPEPPDCPRLRTLVCRLISLAPGEIDALSEAAKETDAERVGPLPPPLQMVSLVAREDAEPIDELEVIAETDDGTDGTILQLVQCDSASFTSNSKTDVKSVGAALQMRTAAAPRWIGFSCLAGALAQVWDPSVMSASFSTTSAPRDRVRACSDAAVSGRCFIAFTPNCDSSCGAMAHQDWSRLREGDEVVSFAPVCATLSIEVASAGFSKPEPDVGVFVTIKGSPVALRVWEDAAPGRAADAEVLLPPFQAYRP